MANANGKKFVYIVNNEKDWAKKLNLVITESERREKQVQREREETFNDLLEKFTVNEG